MKKLLISIIIAAIIIPAFSQEEMPVVWQKKMGINFIHSGTGLEETNYSFVASSKEMAVFSNKDGSIYWKKKFKEIAPNLKKIDELVPFWESNIIFLFDRKMGKDQVACIDITNGKLLWTTDTYQKVTADMIVYIPEDDGFAISLKKELVYIKARTGEEVWTTTKFVGVVGKYIYNPEDKTMVMVNFIPNGLVAFFSGSRNQIIRINMETGDVLWENTYIGRADRKSVTKDFIYNLNIVENKVILQLAGIQLYDYETGATLWSAAFDFTPDFGKPPKDRHHYGVYGAVAKPVIDGDDIYILNMGSRKSQFINKYDFHTGRLLWTSNEIKGANVIPSMNVSNGVVTIQISGMVEEQYYQVTKTETTTTTKAVIKYKNIRPFGIQAFNAEDGTYLWKSERFKKGITNSIMVDNNFIVCSGKSLYSIDVKNGNVNFEIPVSKGGTGLATLIFPYDDKIMVVGEKGLSTFNPADGAFLKNSVYRKSVPSGKIGKVVLMKTSKDDFAAYNLDNLSYRKFNARKGSKTWLELENAKYAYVYEKNKVTKLEVY